MKLRPLKVGEKIETEGWNVLAKLLKRRARWRKSIYRRRPFVVGLGYVPYPHLSRDVFPIEKVCGGVNTRDREKAVDLMHAIVLTGYKHPKLVIEKSDRNSYGVEIVGESA